MEPEAAPELLGDLLALARGAWVRQMGEALRHRGYDGYRRSDALVFRVLRRGPLPLGRVGAVLGTTRQAGRKVVDGLEQRGYATTAPDPRDARRTTVNLTARGERYAVAVVEVVEELNHDLAARLDPDDLESARIVLRAVVAGGGGTDRAR
jgi:DNA-binding MarR family transcriptional regulator